jgi:hypothetical protein
MRVACAGARKVVILYLFGHVVGTIGKVQHTAIVRAGHFGARATGTGTRGRAGGPPVRGRRPVLVRRAVVVSHRLLV